MHYGHRILSWRYKRSTGSQHQRYGEGQLPRSTRNGLQLSSPFFFHPKGQSRRQTTGSGANQRFRYTRRAREQHTEKNSKNDERPCDSVHISAFFNSGLT
jgi:hypothetical protein